MAQAAKENKKLRVCLTHYCVGDTDGVSLEMDKHKIVFEQMGYDVIYLAGVAHCDAHVIPEMDYRTDDSKKIFHNAYEKNDEFKDDEALRDFILAKADFLEGELVKFFKKEKIDLIICHNIFSHALHLPLSIAMCNAIDKCDIKQVIGYHHDFYWERPVFDNPTSKYITEITDNYVPPTKDEKYKKIYAHCTINSIGRNTLLNRKKLDSTIIPNVFNYESDEKWVLDDYNKELYDTLGINVKNGDIVVLQATRIVKRKAIELAIEVVKEMINISNKYYDKELYNGNKFNKDSKFHFVFPGLDQEFDRTYVNYLDKELNECGAKIHKIVDITGHTRKNENETKNGKKQYSLWDSYVICDLVTYPSIQEGWGNQYLEAVYAKRPQLLFEYPVYTDDIKKLGFNNIELGSKYEMVKTEKEGIEIVKVDSKIIAKCAKECMDILFNKDEYNKMVDHNFDVAKNNLSYSNLRKMWEKIFEQYQ